MKRTFLEFVQIKQKDQQGQSSVGDTETSVNSRITLGDGNDFPPLVVSDDPNSQFYGKNSGLAVIIRAFKKGANWGWSKDDKSGEDKPVKMGGKKLFMTGGAIRDHLAGKKSRNQELVTNASPDEVYHILSQNGFQFIDKEGAANQTPQGKATFWVNQQDKKGRPYAFGIKVKNDEFEMSVFTKTSKGQDGKLLEPGNHSDDASSRDFTMNAMYLALVNDNGPNKDLYDFYGGMRHLLDGRVAPVGNLEMKLKEDPIRALRYARMLARYGDPRKIPEDERAVIKGASEHIAKLKPQILMDEFLRGLNYEDVDARKYLKIYNFLGLLSPLFPNMQLDTNFPKELQEIGDKHASLAWMLRQHPPENVEQGLSTIWRPNDLKKIAFLIKSLQKLDDYTDDSTLEDLVQGYLNSGLSSRKLKVWLSRLGGKSEPMIDAFIQHAHAPRVQMFAAGTDIPNEPFNDLVDPFSGQLSTEDAHARKRNMEWENWRALLAHHMPKNI